MPEFKTIEMNKTQLVSLQPSAVIKQATMLIQKQRLENVKEANKELYRIHVVAKSGMVPFPVKKVTLKRLSCCSFQKFYTV